MRQIREDVVVSLIWPSDRESYMNDANSNRRGTRGLSFKHDMNGGICDVSLGSVIMILLGAQTKQTMCDVVQRLAVRVTGTETVDVCPPAVQKRLKHKGKRFVSGNDIPVFNGLPGSLLCGIRGSLVPSMNAM